VGAFRADVHAAVFVGEFRTAFRTFWHRAHGTFPALAILYRTSVLNTEPKKARGQSEN